MKCVSSLVLFFLLAVNSLVGGCTSVRVSVNSIKNVPQITRSFALIFPKKSEAIETEKIRRECAKGAHAAKITVVESCTANCLWVVVEGTTGPSKERTTSFSNFPNYYWSRQNQVYSYDVTQKQVKMTLYSDPEMKQVAYQAILDSIGMQNNVLADAEEMCEAGFKAFPNEFSGREYNIQSR